MIDLDVRLSGLVFNGELPARIARMRADAEQSVAQAAMELLHRLMDRLIRNPTPYYETQIIMERQANDLVIHDRKIVYGPWLEGVGTRNRSTRFKGYRWWRITKQEIGARVPELVAHVKDRWF